MLRTFALLATMLLLTGLSCGEAVPCSVSGSSDDAVSCPGGPSTKRATAVETLKAFESSIRGEFPEAIWMGGIMGFNIGRDGKVLDQSPGLLRPTTWFGNFCNNSGTVPMDSLHFDTTAGECTVVRTCQVVDCSKVPVHTFPAIDSDAAIHAAFPSDPDGTLYTMQLVQDVSSNWSIVRLASDGQANGDAVLVDSETGEVK